MHKKVSFIILIFCSFIVNTVVWGAEVIEVTPEADEIRRIYAFHATYQLPIDGRMVPGKANNDSKKPEDKGKPLTGVVGWRPTLHFSLGSVCPDSAENTLSTRNHVIIVQVKDLENQLIGLQPFDSFVMGEFLIPQDASVIVPAEEVETTKACDWVKLRNITVIGREGTLNSQVERFLIDHEGWIFRGDDETKHPLGLKLKPTLQKVETVKQPFFRKFLAQVPHVDYAPHCQHRIGFLNLNAHYLFCKKKALEIPGQEELRDLFDAILPTYIAFLKSTGKESLADYLKIKIEELKREALQNKQKSEDIRTLYFGNDQIFLAEHAQTWITKGRYLHDKTIKRIHVEGMAKIETEEIEFYLQRIGMIP